MAIDLACKGGMRTARFNLGTIQYMRARCVSHWPNGVTLLVLDGCASRHLCTSEHSPAAAMFLSLLLVLTFLTILTINTFLWLAKRHKASPAAYCLAYHYGPFALKPVITLRLP